MAPIGEPGRAGPLHLGYRRPVYDHNQTLVPEAFLAIHAIHGRPTLSRQETEARHDLCEDLALHAAAFLAGHHPDPDRADASLRQCLDGLLAAPAQVSQAEARWVTQRVAELQEWPLPAWLATG